MRRKIGSIGMVFVLLVGPIIGILNLGAMNARGTAVSGIVFDGSGGPWTISGNPYTVVDDVIVPSGQTLTINPGVRVNFIGDYSIFVKGNVYAIGTESQKIVMASSYKGSVQINSTGHAEIQYNDINLRYGIRLFSSSNNNISNNIFSNNHAGIDLWWSSHNIINNNHFSNNGVGISLFYPCNYNLITNNSISSNEGRGIIIAGSSYNTISNNNISNNHFGIEFFLSPDNYITDNNFHSNDKIGIYISNSKNSTIANNNFVNDGISINGGEVSHLNSHMISDNNLVNGKSLYYYKNCSGFAIDGIAIGQLILANCTNINVKNLQINNTYAGVALGFSNNITIINNNFSSSNKYGVYQLYSSNNTVMNNNLSSNDEGIFLHYSHYNNIVGNNLSYNKYGVSIDSSSNNRIYHNNFINNQNLQAYDNTNENFWNDTYPSGGNYWSDHSPTCLDLYDGTATPQTSGSPDGFCDDPYAKSSNIKDYYPLKYQWGTTPPTDTSNFLSEYWWLLLVVVAILVAEIAIILLLKRKKKKPVEVAPETLSPPQTPQQIPPHSPLPPPPPP